MNDNFENGDKEPSILDLLAGVFGKEAGRQLAAEIWQTNANRQEAIALARVKAQRAEVVIAAAERLQVESQACFQRALTVWQALVSGRIDLLKMDFQSLFNGMDKQTARRYIQRFGVPVSADPDLPKLQFPACMGVMLDPAYTQYISTSQAFNPGSEAPKLHFDSLLGLDSLLSSEVNPSFTPTISLPLIPTYLNCNFQLVWV